MASLYVDNFTTVKYKGLYEHNEPNSELDHTNNSLVRESNSQHLSAAISAKQQL